MKDRKRKRDIVGFLALITSTGPLFCCVLPAVIATMAGGSAIASLISVFPWLTPLSHYEMWLFAGAGLLIIISGIFILSPEGKIVRSITRGRGFDQPGRFQKLMFWSSVIIFLAGILVGPLMK